MKFKILFIVLFSIFSYSVQSKYNPKTYIKKHTIIHNLQSNNFDVFGLLYSDEKISISHIYPSPAINYAAFDYQLVSNTIAEITFYNVLGNQSGKYPLYSEKNKIKISLDNFSSGVYFYTLSVDHKDRITRKFIIGK